MMLKSKVWRILVIVVGVLLSLALGVGIYFFIQAQQSVTI
jgi:flagellar basal body-associated protein FliL